MASEILKVTSVYDISQHHIHPNEDTIDVCFVLQKYTEVLFSGNIVEYAEGITLPLALYILWGVRNNFNDMILCAYKKH